MVDFATHGGPLIGADIAVAAASVDSIEQTQALKDGLRVGFPMYAEVDVHAVAEATGAFFQDDENRTILHATSFLLAPDGTINNALYSTGPIGRFTSSDILRKVAFERSRG